ncbi:MAG TPA: DUF4129 domain-containing protein [Streptosporangiaceae bacterium]|nr:DUF4129 domain-containing protein [Streptosporangiaceae bacterium]
MPDRLTSRTVLAALLLLLTIAGIRAAGSAVTTSTPALPLLTGTGCALEAVLAALLVMLRWRRRPRGSQADPATDPVTGPAARLRLMLTGVIVIGLIAIPAAILIASLARIRPRRRPPQRRLRPGGRPGRLHPGHVVHAPAAVTYLQYVLLALVIAAIIAAAVMLWRRRRRWSRPPRIPVAPDLETDTPAELARAVDSGRVALRELDDARAAIIGCYVAVEDSLAEAGAARAAAETPDELLDRAVTGGIVSAAPAGRLTALFYEARFSTHTMPSSRRDDAERALAEIAATLTPVPGAHTAAGPGAGGAP